jgi:hypothetical protein
MKDRIFDWPTTLMGLGILAFVAVIVWRHPLILDKPELLLMVAAGLAGIISKTSSSK